MEALIPVVCTPLLGGRQYGAVCTLLEIGNTRLLLDCGRLFGTELEALLRAAEEIASGPIDAILLSHADMAHIGGLPSIFGAKGLRGIPVICTLPVLKMGQMVLYDYYSNVASEGIDGDSLPFTLDDVDACFSHVRTVKYNQTIEIESSALHSGGLYTSICALPAGRTIGGCMWHIKHGTAEVLYAMDVNLKKELVLDGGTMDLPQSPALLITDGGGSNPSRTQANVGGGATGSRRKRTAAAVVEREESLINAVMETVRMEGNVLIPCETAGRTLEILQILGKYWTENKFTGMYHLCFLSPMGKNVLEFAKSQLEWMSESISRGFYVGKPNPFALPNLNVCSTIKEILLLGNGPKVVLVTDASLSLGLSKELLLRWGGDPRCRVIFVDQPEPGTLAAEIRLIASSPPIIATVTRPERVLLEGTELSDFIAHQQEDERRQGEAEHRRMRERELAQLVAGGEGEDDTDHSEESEDEGRPTGLLSLSSPTSLKRNISFESMTADGATKRLKANPEADEDQSGRIAHYARPRYTMFETRLMEAPSDEYGVMNSDLKFASSITSTALLPRHGKPNSAPVSEKNRTGAGAGRAKEDAHALDSNPAFASAPSKIVTKKMRIQFTCGFKEMPPLLWGRIDLKGLKTIIGKVCPSRVILLRGTAEDCDTVANQTKRSGVESYAPANFQPIGFSVRADRIRVLLPHKYLDPGRRHVIHGAVAGQSTDTVCSVSLTSGFLRRISPSMVASSQSLSARVAEARADGVQLLQLVDSVLTAEAPPAEATTTAATASGECDHEGNNEQETEALEKQEEESAGVAGLPSDYSSLLTESLPRLSGSEVGDGGHSYGSSSGVSVQEGAVRIGAISVGEVLLKTLQAELEKSSVSVEYKLIPGGAILLCAGQVIVRKENENDFVVEGPPCQAYFQIKNAIYRQFAFI